MRNTHRGPSKTAAGRLPLAMIGQPSLWAMAVFAAACFSAVDLLGGEKAASSAPQGLPAVPHPDDNPPSAAKTRLGKQLFFDRRLSRGNAQSCADCHNPQTGYSNAKRFATGVTGAKGNRSAPTIINVAYNRFLFWDGRAPSLEAQALGPIQNPIEMNMSLPDLVEKLNGVEAYREAFQEVFGGDITPERLAKAIAAYERTVLSGDAPFDRYKAGDKKAFSEAAQRGMKLFFGKANCSACHAGPNLTDNAFHNIGIGMDSDNPDVGRQAISKLGGDRGSFKTPTLREVARTAPYMHDGSLKTLEEVIEHYNKGGVKNEWLDEELFPLELTGQEKSDLVTFLTEGLSSESYPLHKPPELPK